MNVDKYARTILAPNKQVDGLFLLLAARKFGAHIAVMHMDGVWSTHPNGWFLEMDIMLVQTMDGFREVLQIKDDTNVFDTLGNASGLESVWTSQPPVLDAPVANPTLCAEDAGYKI